MEAPFFDARWISGPDYDYGTDDAGYYDDHPNHVLSRIFTLEIGKGRAKEAVLNLAVLGYAKVTINGRRVGGVELLGDWTNFTKLVYYDSFDVSDLVKAGENRLMIELGNGWYNPSPLTLFGKYDLRERLAEVGTPKALASLVVDGEPVVVSDASWQCVEGPLLFNNVYLGERADLGWEPRTRLPIVEERDVRSLQPAAVERCRAFEAIEPTATTELIDGSLLVDFGVLETGFADIAFTAHAGDRVVIRYAERLDEDGLPSYESSLAGLVGEVVPDGTQVPGGPGAPARAIQTDVLLCREGENRFRNSFTYHSCRFACVEGLSKDQIRSFAFIPVHTALSPAGTLECGNRDFAELLDAAIRTKLNNVHGVWEDCARERLGYGGDMVALSASNLMAFDCEALIRKTVRDIRNDQTEAGGVPETAPFMGIGSHGTAYGEGPILWQLAYPHLVLRAYQFYGAKNLVYQEWPHVKRLVDYLLSWDPAELATHCIGDHGALAIGGDFRADTPDKELVGWCTIARFARAAVKCCTILGEDPAPYAERFEALRSQIRDRFVNADGTFGDGTQTGLAFAADLGLGDEAALADALARKFDEEGGVLTTGIFGATLAYDILRTNGHSDVIERWLLREDPPSLKSMLATGNGALAEQFTTMLSSFNHAMFSSYVQWLYEALAGIKVADDACACDHLELNPYFSHATDHVKALYHTPRGIVSVEWSRDAQGVRFEANYPHSVRATLGFPEDSVITVREGSVTALVPGA